MKHIPLDQIDPTSLPRDRTNLCEDALFELINSITLHGLRTPIEIYPIEGPIPWGLLSGFRRYTAFTRMAELNDKYKSIPTTLREPKTIPEALTLMVEENAARTDISPYEQGAIAVTATRAEHFDTLDAAITALYPAASRQKRARLRALANVVETLDGLLTDPHTWSQNQLLRLDAAIRFGWTEIIDAALEAAPRAPAPDQWAILQGLLAEAEMEKKPITSRPRRLVHVPSEGITIRRERTPRGFCLHITGPKASSALTEEILERVERGYDVGR